MRDFTERFLYRFSKGAVDSLIVAMSRRIVGYEDQLWLTELMDKLAADLNENTRISALRNINDNMEWLAGNSYGIVQNFVTNFADAAVAVENQLILPRSSMPSHYRLHIDARNIQTGDRAFTGEVEIDLTIKQRTDHILLHSKTQVIDELKVYTLDRQNEILVINHHLYPATDTLAIYFLRDLNVNTELTVHIKYSTNLPTSGSGFYQTSYLTSNNVRRYLGATQFQPASGRYAFPHYDEPGFKAIFDLKITHDVTYSAIANTFGVEVNK